MSESLLTAIPITIGCCSLAFGYLASRRIGLRKASTVVGLYVIVWGAANLALRRNVNPTEPVRMNNWTYYSNSMSETDLITEPRTHQFIHFDTEYNAFVNIDEYDFVFDSQMDSTTTATSIVDSSGRATTKASKRASGGTMLRESDDSQGLAGEKRSSESRFRLVVSVSQQCVATTPGKRVKRDPWLVDEKKFETDSTLCVKITMEQDSVDSLVRFIGFADVSISNRSNGQYYVEMGPFECVRKSSASRIATYRNSATIVLHGFEKPLPGWNQVCIAFMGLKGCGYFRFVVHETGWIQ
jgi:hypothetical protein